MIIYLVSTGDYSDYHVVGAFSTKEKALEAFPSKDYGIEEYELDKPTVVLKRVYSDVIAISDGSRWIGSTPDHDGTTHFASKLDEVDIGFRGKYDFLQWDWPKSHGTSHVYAKSVISQEHATKLAAEGRQAFLRNDKALSHN